MPIHNWTKVPANQFHDFHQRWTIAISNALNAGCLPDGYFAMVEQSAGGPEADVIALELRGHRAPDGGGLAIKTEPPRTRFVARAETAGYAQKANRIVVHHPDGDVVAFIEIVSPGNKSSRHAIQTFVRKAVSLLQAGANLLVVDLFPPSPRDPRGIHGLIWDSIGEDAFELPSDKPLTLASYEAGVETVAYVEPVAVGETIPDMPLFLAPCHYVPCPLESTYLTAWEQFPRQLKANFD